MLIHYLMHVAVIAEKHVADETRKLCFIVSGILDGDSDCRVSFLVLRDGSLHSVENIGSQRVSSSPQMFSKQVLCGASLSCVWLVPRPTSRHLPGMECSR